MSCLPPQDKTIYKGQTAKWVLKVLDEDGDPFDLTSTTLYLRVKASTSDADPALVALLTGSGITNQTQTGSTIGWADVLMTPTQTNLLTALNYFYDAWSDTAGDRAVIVPVSKFTVKVPVTNL